MAGRTPFTHPDPGVNMPVPRDMERAPGGPYERLTEEDSNKTLAKSQRPGHKDNRGGSPALGVRKEAGE